LVGIAVQIGPILIALHPYVDDAQYRLGIEEIRVPVVDEYFLTGLTILCAIMLARDLG
jgi:hypothetical protein